MKNSVNPPSWTKRSEAVVRLGSGEQHSPDWSSFICPAQNVGPGRPNVIHTEGWDVYFNKQHICRRLSREDARRVIRSLKQDPNLAEVIQVHES